MHFSASGKSFDPISYKRSNLLKIKDICLVQTALFMYDYDKHNLPPAFNGYFIPQLRDGMVTRGNENNYYQQFTKTKYANLCIKTAGVKAWKFVPNKIKASKSRFILKKLLKRHILISYLANI